MGLSLKVGEDEIRITNFVDFNKFLNEASKYGRFPNMLGKSWAYGSFRSDYIGDDKLWTGSLEDLVAEIDVLSDMPLTRFSKFILSRIKHACTIAQKKEENIQII